MRKHFLIAFFLVFVFLLSPEQIYADCGWIENNPTCLTNDGGHNYEICSDECGGIDNVLGCASLYGVGSPNECVCDDLECTGPENCPTVSLNPACYNAQSGGNILGDIPPYVKCGGVGGGEYECCSVESECSVPPAGEGECYSFQPDADAQCHVDNGGPCQCGGYCIDEDANGVGSCECQACSNLGYLCADGLSINTAIGCIPVSNTSEFISFLLGWGVGIAGGIAFILIVTAAIMILTSAGNPQKIQAGKELLTAAISGLMLIVLGTFVLEFVGVDILNIPGFGGS